MTQAAQLAQYGASSVGLAFKNRIINGAMVINQRGGTAVSNSYVTDRFGWISTSGTVTAQQSSIAPSGFINSLAITCTSAGTRNASDYFIIQQPIEGLNISDFAEGTSAASTYTLSFWVRSSVTGTYSGATTSGDNTRVYAFNYTINSANTWEQKSVTIVGDTTGSTTNWPTTNSVGMIVRFDLGSGSNFQTTAGSWQVASNRSGTAGTVGWAQTNGATFYITGVQLEKGSTATSFDYRPYGTELNLCQRYFYKWTAEKAIVVARDTNLWFARYNAAPAFRATPTMSSNLTTRVASGSPANAGEMSIFSNGWAGASGSVSFALDGADTSGATFYITGWAATAGADGTILTTSSGGVNQTSFNFSAEL